MGSQPARSSRYFENGLLTPHAVLGSDIPHRAGAKLGEMRPAMQLL